MVADIDIFFKGKRIGNNPSYVFYEHVGSLVDIHNKSDIKFAESLIDAGFNSIDIENINQEIESLDFND